MQAMNQPQLSLFSPFHYSESSQKQLVICVHDYNNQHRPPILAIQMSTVNIDYIAITLESFDGGTERPKNTLELVDVKS